MVEVIVPVHNEEDDLGPSIRRLHDHLSNGFPFSWRITIADNASTDATPAVACLLAEELLGVRVVRFDEKGRGRALRHTWLDTDATVVAYMDVDLATVLGDLRGIARLARGLATGSLPLAQLRAALTEPQDVVHPVADGVPPGLPRQLGRFAVIGLASTLLYTVLYLMLRPDAGPQAANAISLLVTAIVNTAANRRFTFAARGRGGVLRHQAEGLVVFGLGLAVTSGSLAVLQLLATSVSAGVELAVLVTANLIATVLRFVMLRSWVFHPGRRRSAHGLHPVAEESAT